MIQAFDYKTDFRNTDFRTEPEKYKIGKGEQGVLLVQPYKSEILPFWKFKTPELAAQSAQKIYSLFEQYKNNREFVGMEMARKFLQMGITRSRRYANHKSGKKYDGPVPEDKKGVSGAHGRQQLPQDPDPVKAQCAIEFDNYYQKVIHDQIYIEWKVLHLKNYK